MPQCPIRRGFPNQPHLENRGNGLGQPRAGQHMGLGPSQCRPVWSTRQASLSTEIFYSPAWAGVTFPELSSSPVELMKLARAAQSFFGVAQRGCLAAAVSTVLMLPIVLPVPPALADGDVRSTHPWTTLFHASCPDLARAGPHSWPLRRIVLLTIAPCALCSPKSTATDEAVQIPVDRPIKKGPLPVCIVCNGPGERGARQPV